MNFETSKKILRVCGILILIGSVLEVVSGIFSMFLGGAAAQAPELASDQEIQGGIAALLLGGGSELVSGIIGTIEGYVCYCAGKDGTYTNAAYIFAILGLISAGLSLASLFVRNIFAWQTIVSGVLSFLLSFMLFMAAKKVRDTAE